MGFGVDTICLARVAVESDILGGKVVMLSDPAFGKRFGAFATLSGYPERPVRMHWVPDAGPPAGGSHIEGS